MSEIEALDALVFIVVVDAQPLSSNAQFTAGRISDRPRC
jgi:hypothetical protein